VIDLHIFSLIELFWTGLQSISTRLLGRARPISTGSCDHLIPIIRHWRSYFSAQKSYENLALIS